MVPGNASAEHRQSFRFDLVHRGKPKCAGRTHGHAPRRQAQDQPVFAPEPVAEPSPVEELVEEVAETVEPEQ